MQTLDALLARLLTNPDALLEDAASQLNALGAPRGQIKDLGAAWIPSDPVQLVTVPISTARTAPSICA